MNITIKDLLSLKAYKEAKVLGGEGGLDNIVLGITIMEDTTISEWLKGGEIIITSLIPVKGLSRDERISFFEGLLNKKLSGLIIKTGKYIEKVPLKLIEWGEENSIPIIEIPRHVLYTDIMYPTMSEILEKQVFQLEYFRKIHEKFREMAIKDCSIGQVIEVLSDIIGNPVEIYDKNHNLILSTFRDPIDIILKVEDRENLINKNLYKYSKINIESTELNQIITKISAIEDTSLYLSVIELNKEITELDFLAIENACTNVALNMTKNIAVKEVEERFMNDIVNNILFRKPELSDTLLKKANISGIDLFGNYFISVLNMKVDIDDIKYNLKKKLGRLVKKYQGLYSLRDDNIIIFIKEKKDIDNSKLLKEFKIDLNNLNLFILSICKDNGFIAGIGRKAKGYENFIKSYQQALDAINIGRELNKDNIIFDYEELGSFKLISDIAKSKDIKTYIPTSVLSLMEIDKEKNSELLKTLEAYIKNNNHIKNTSKELFIHPKTVSYRLEQIKSLTATDLEDSDQLFEIQIGIKILNFLESK